MRFRPGARLNTGQVRDRRGGAGLAVGGGAGTILIVIVLALLGVDLPGGTSAIPLDEPATDLSQTCQTGSDANQREDCRIVGVVNSVQEYWSGQLDGYREAPTNFFSGQVSTGCGDGQLGRRAVLLPGRPERLHRPRLLRRAAQPLRRAGRPVRRGVRDRARVRAPRPAPARHRRARRRRPRGRDVGLGPARAAGRLLRRRVGRARGRDRLHRGPHARPTSPTGSTRRPSIGDDRIQEQATGRVDPESWTHGSSASRQKWFNTGYRTGDPRRCDTFATSDL